MGQGEAENLPTWSTQIQNCDRSQATDFLVQQSKGQGAAKNREVDHGDAGHGLRVSLRTRER